MRVRRRLRIAALAALGALLAGCTGIPTTSSPEVVGTLQANAPQQQPPQTPLPGESPRGIVFNFLNYNASNDEHHAAARQYLTSEERTRWSDTAGATILDSVRIGSEFDSVHNTITVTGHVVGTLDQNGVYKPTLQGDGTSSSRGALLQGTISLKQVHDQWRISNLQGFSGLLLSQAQFAEKYSPWAVYFYDQAEQRVVPSWRYSQLTDNEALGTWLLDQLVGGPAASPTTTALSTDLPSIPSTAQLKLTMGRQTVVEVPGASQLTAEQRYRMAAQVALTLGPAAPNVPIEITDGGHPVPIPSLGSPTFSASDFASAVPVASADPSLYFIYNGGISDGRGRQLPGSLGNGSYNLTSAALARIPGSHRLRVAATSGSTKDSQLLMGQTGGSLHQTSLSGRLSRPDWMPGLDEVWIGDGAKLYRIGDDGRAHVVPIVANSGTISGRIRAVRVSPEGARVALVLASGDTSQIWIGAIVRSATAVQVSGAIPISPVGVVVKDVAWGGDQRTLYAVGYSRASNDASVYTVRCDGSFWSSNGIGGLPDAPDSITVATGVYPPEPAVGASQQIWVLPNGFQSNWASPDPDNTFTLGTNPYWVN